MSVTEDTVVAVAESTMVLSEISKHYDGVAALTGVTLDIRPGEVHALLGENGAGKSTLMGVASGTTVPDGGTITMNGQLLDGLSPAVATQQGIAIVHQHPAVLPDMTVAENIRVAVPASVLGARTNQYAAMRDMLDDVGSTAHLEDRVGSLTVAQKHLLELAKALVLKPTLLILDEPTAPLGRDAVDLLFARVRKAAASRHRRRLHHPPPGRGPRPRHPGDGAARRQGPRQRSGRRDQRRRAAGTHRRAAAGLHLPAQADRRRRQRDGADRRRPDGSGLLRRLLRGSPRRDHRGLGHRRQRPERPAARAGRARVVRRHPAGGGPRALEQAAPAARGLPAGRPAQRGPDDDPLGPREHCGLGTAELPPRTAAEPSGRGHRRRPRADLAGREDALPRGRRLRPVRRKPAEGRPGPRSAVEAGHARRRRTDPGCRRGCAGRDLPDPP